MRLHPPVLRPSRAAAAVFAGLLAPLPLLAGITAGKNLLTNGSGTDALTVGWTVLTNGGNGWAVGGGGYDDEGGHFITSYGLCQRSQTIDLIAAGATTAELDAAPPIRVSEAISSYLNNTPDTYYIRVELRDATGGVLARWDAGTATARKTAGTSWVEEAFEFRDYGPGLRSIYFEDGGVDAGFWAGSYGTYHDAARVEFLNLPITDITLTPGTMPANVPAGGLAGQLRAVDPDNDRHSFALEAETTVATQELVLAGEDGWRFLDTGVEETNWKARLFNDAAWGTGLAPLGYDSSGADTWKATEIGYGGDPANKPLTTWFRKTFTVANPAGISGLSATILVDDGAVVYLNGEELFRDGIEDGIDVDAFTPANRTVGGTDESDYTTVTIPPEKLALLVAGQNTLAVEVHQDKITSSDIGIDLTLTATVATSTNAYANDLFTVSGTELRVKNGSAGLAPGDYTVRVKATDPAGNSFARLLTVQRTTAIFQNTPTSLTLTPATLRENAPDGTLIGTFATVDADAGDAHRYALVAGPGGDDNARVTISDNRLFTAQVLDYETLTRLALLVQVTDSEGLSITRPLTVAVLDDTTEDEDGDGLSEAEEDLNNNGQLDAGETDPLLADTDGDGYPDGAERRAGTDPRNPASVPSVLELRQIATHATGDSWLTGASWETGLPPEAIHMTLTDNMTLRTPPEADPVFPGAGAELRNGAIFRLKHTGLAYVPRILLENATLQHGMTVPISIGGSGTLLEVPVSATIDTAGAELEIAAALTGAGRIRVTGTTGGRLRLSLPAQGFTGELIQENPELILTDPEAAGHARLILVTTGTLRTESDTQLPDTVLQRTGTGQISLTNTITAGAFVADGVIVPAGSWTGSELIAMGVPAAAVEDLGGTLTITGFAATRDTDGDGASDLLEILARTDPTDSASVLRLQPPVSAGPGTVSLQWNAVAGVRYTVQYSDDLSFWQDLDTVTPTSATGRYDTATSGGRSYFRLALK